MNNLVAVLAVVRFFFFNDTATTEIYTLSLHDALPIFARCGFPIIPAFDFKFNGATDEFDEQRSEEHTSELQSQSNLVCRLLLEKKKHGRASRLRTLGPRLLPLQTADRAHARSLVATPT